MKKYSLLFALIILFSVTATAPASEPILKGAYRNFEIESKFELYHLLAAYALRTNDLTYCREAVPDNNGVAECIKRVESYYLLKHAAKGDCASLHREPFKILCKEIKNGGQNTNNECLHKLYEWLMAKDYKAIADATWMPYWAFREEIMSEDTARYFISFFYAFRNQSIDHVDDYLDKNSPYYLYQKATLAILLKPEFSTAELKTLYSDLVKQYSEMKPVESE